MLDANVTHAAVAYANALLHAEAGDHEGAAAHFQQCADATVSNRVAKMVLMEQCCPFRSRLLDDLAYVGLQEEFRDLCVVSALNDQYTFNHFVRHLKSELVERSQGASHHVGERSFAAGLMLFVRYLIVSRWEREEQARNVPPPPHSMAAFQCQQNFDIHRVAVRCIHMTSSFGDGRQFAEPFEEQLYHNHILKSLRFDVAETSPLDFIGVVERLSSLGAAQVALSEACMVKFQALLESPALFYCCTSARVCAVLVLAILKDHGQFHPLWIHNWPHPLVQVLELLSPTTHQ